MSTDPTPMGPPHWRGETLVLLLAGVVLAGTALAIPAPALLFLAFPILLAPAVAALGSPRPTKPARLEWRAEGSTADVTIVGTVSLPPELPASSVDMTFYRPPPLEEQTRPEVTPTEGRLRFVARWRAPYPCIVTVPRPDLLWRDPYGLIERRLTLDASSLRVERFPPEIVRLGSVRLRRTTPLPGEVRSRALGPTGEFFAIRPATPGDTPRQVNWWASARTGRLLANDYLRERTGDLLILLDLRPTSLGERRDRTLISISSAAALGIASGFLAEKARVGLGIYDEFLTAVPLGSGRLQRFKILRALDKARVAENPGPSERFAVSLHRYFPPGITTILLSPLADEEPLILLSHLRRRGYPTIVLSPSPVPLVMPSTQGLSTDDQLALRLLSLVRRLRVSRAWREGPVVEWPDYWSLTPLVRYLKTPPRNIRGAA